MSATTKFFCAIILYAVIGFLNGGYYYNHHVYDSRTYDHLSRGNDSVAVGVFWPIYWGGRIAIEVTK